MAISLTREHRIGPWVFLGAVLLATAPVFPADPLTASPDAPWTDAEAAHLLRRAGFGGTPEQIDYLVGLGRDESVDLLVDYQHTEQDDPAYPADAFPDRPPPLRGIVGMTEQQRRAVTQSVVRLGAGHATAMRDWWLRRMIVTARPLEEKMTLFWHGHFTSGMREVKQPEFMYRQNEFLRSHALADFRTLLRGISRDPAMLVYLDNGSNVKARPNENYARELMELFTMGEGNYSEQDVKEAARAFTGWGFDRRVGGEFTVRRYQHDNGEKTFLGRTGQFDGDDIIDIILEQPETARYLAGKLWTHFVAPDPEVAQIAAVAELLGTTDFDLRETLRALFRSDAFYAASARHSLYKSPTELMVGTVRRLEIPPNDLRAANEAMKQMGQELFQPPNVKGWPGGRDWINPSTLFIRYNAMGGMIYGTPGPRQTGELDRRFQAFIAAVRGDSKEASGGKAAIPRLDRKAAPGARRQAVREGIARAGQRDEQGDDEMMMLPAGADAWPESMRAWVQTIKPPPEYASTQPVYDPMPTVKKFNLRSAEGVVDHYIDRLLQMDLPRSHRAVLVDALKGEGRKFDARDAAAADSIRGMLRVMLSMPEYQLN